MIHSAVEEYVNDDDLTVDEEWFPNRTDLEGSYYLGDEHYGGEFPIDEDWPRLPLSIRARCLGDEGGAIRDYLGLEVHLLLDVRTGALELGGVDHSVI